MKRVYTILIAAMVICLALFTRSAWWLAAGVLGFMGFLIYRIYASRLYTMEIRAAALQQQVQELHDQLDASIRKEQRLSKAAEQATAVKKQVMASMSHEIRTPMNGVMGMASLMAETPLSDIQRDYINSIRQCGEQLLSVVNHILVDDMLNVSKAGDNSNVPAIDDFDLRACIEEVLEMFGSTVGDSGTDLLYAIDEGIPGQLSGDGGRLRQVLINLVDNAVKFTSQGEVYIGVHLLRKAEDHTLELAFEVRDTGRGIPADKLQGIFEGLSGTIPADNGNETAGLGLVICRRLVEMMGGWIEVQSEPEKGCVFTFCIRVLPGRKPLRNALHPGMSALRGKRILIVDDNAVARGLLARQLQQWEAEPSTAGSGREALNALSVETFDLVITDTAMPGMNGPALKKQIREQYPNLAVIMPVKPVKQHILRDQLLHLFYSSANSPQPAKNNGEKLLADFSQRHPLRILVAEDNPINQKLALRMLGKLGYQPKMTGNGKEVLEELSQNRYDLVLMDVQMPEMDGLEATRMIRLCLDSQPIIIAMTANAMQGDRDLCLQAGMDDYISKPIELDELLAQLEKWSTIRKNT